MSLLSEASNEDIEIIVKYRHAQAKELNAQAEAAEIWATMTQAQRRLAISGTVDRLVKR